MAEKKQSVEYIASVEHLDRALTVVGFKGWIFLWFAIFLGLGVIVWSFVGTIPISVTGKAVILNSQIYGFVNLREGAAIHEGMDAKVAFNAVNSSLYGMLKGNVKEVMPYPASLTDPQIQQIPSESLREYLVQGEGPSYLVLIEPILDSKTPSGFAWTSNEGPPIQITSGMIGTVRITLDKVKPISYVIPAIGKK